MVIIKTIVLIVPLLILLLSAILLFSLRKVFFKRNVTKKVRNDILTCSACGVGVHESLTRKKNSKIYCSEECINS